MLVLTIKENDSVKIGNSEITVRKIKGGWVKIAFDCPKDVKVLRSSLSDANEQHQRNVKCGSRDGNIRGWKRE